MKLKNKIIAACSTLALSLGLTVAVAAPAQAAYNDVLHTTSSRCVQWVPTGWNVKYYMSHCGPGYSTRDVGYVRIAPGTCRDIGYWSFRTYCASLYYPLYVDISGYNYIR
jgi:hypothetical protein